MCAGTSSTEKETVAALSVGRLIGWALPARLLLSPSVVLLKEPIKQFDSRCRTDRPASHLPEGMEPMIRIEVPPAICIHNGSVKRHMQLSHASYVRIGLVTKPDVVDQVVQLRQTEFTTQHDFAPLHIKRLAKLFQRTCRCGARESVKYIGWRVPRIVPHTRAVRDRPQLVEA